MSLSNVEIASASVEDDESSKIEKGAEDNEEMEEGELLEEGELSDAGDNVDVSNNSNSGPRTTTNSQQHKLITDQHHYSSSSSSHQRSISKKDKPPKDKSPSHSKDSSSKKRKHEQQNSSSTSDTKVSSEDVNDVEAFLKKKKLELAEKVKNQLRIAGGDNTKGESGDESDSESKNRITSPHSTAKRPSVSEGTASSTAAKYYDLDKAEDPTETMISNWSKGKHSDKAKVRSPTVGYDPYDEYYQSSTQTESEASKIDQDYRFGTIANTSDQDFRFGSGYDIDYRKKSALVDAVFGSSSDGSEGDGFSEEEENAANEFGDIDERHRPAATKRGRGRRGGLRNRRGRRYDDSGNESNDDVDNPDRSVRRGGARLEAPRRRQRSRSPMVRRRGLMKDPDRPGGGNEMPLCKFFRDGYCREGDSCPFVHDTAELSRPVEKKAELCKFYSNGFCRNGQRCPFMHGEYPCKFYHKGDCSKGDSCRYSHEQLNDVTRPIFERMLKDEELASKVSVPDAPSRRKVLLGEPPKLGPPPPINGPHPSINNQQAAYGDVKPSHESSFAPAVPQASTSAATHETRMSPLKDLSNNESKDDVAGTSGKVTIDMAAMLRQIKADVTGEEIQESPASPEPMNEPLRQFVVVRQPSDLVDYRLITFDLPPKDPAFNSMLVQSSLTDPKLANDPRIKKLLSSQFDAVSDMISSQNAARDQLDSSMSRDPRAKSDPRLSGANVRDPRLKPPVGYAGTSPQHQTASPANKVELPPPSGMYGMNPVMPQVPLIMTPNYGPMSTAPVVTAPNFAPMNTMLMNPPNSSMYPPPPPNPMMMNVPVNNLPQMSIGPVANAMAVQSSTSASWMPQINSVSGPPQPNVSPNNWMPQQPMMQESPNQRYNPPPAPQGQAYSGPVMDIQSKDPRSRRLAPPNPNRDYPGYASPSRQTSPDNRDVNMRDVIPPNDRFAPSNMHRTSSETTTISLREKRKNLEYESPLSNFGASKSVSSADENRFNTYSGSIKLKKKGSVEDRNEM